MIDPFFFVMSFAIFLHFTIRLILSQNKGCHIVLICGDGVDPKVQALSLSVYPPAI